MTAHDLGLAIGALLFLLLGSSVTAWAGRQLWLFRRSASWPKAEGVVTQAQVVKESDDGATWFVPRVEYSFTVGGQRVSGTAIQFGFPDERFSSPAAAAGRLAEFPVGKAVSVTHHPHVPTQCALQAAISRGVYGVLGFGVVMTSGAIWMRVDSRLNVTGGGSPSGLR